VKSNCGPNVMLHRVSSIASPRSMISSCSMIQTLAIEFCQ
jgi:hypothetical protein